MHRMRELALSDEKKEYPAGDATAQDHEGSAAEAEVVVKD